MIIYTRMGWLVPVVWIAAMMLATKIPPQQIANYGFGLSQVNAMFLMAAVLSAPLLFVIGSVLNRQKVARQIVRFGKPKTVNWGTHTFYLLPVEFWALMIPGATIVASVILHFV